MAVFPPDASCRLHPDVAAVALCSRCGSFVCEDCRLDRDPVRCPRCHEVALGAAPSGQAVAALVLATCGFAGFVPGIVGLVLARREIDRIRRGEAPLRGLGYAELARNLGWFHAAMLAASLIALAAWALG